MMFFFIFIFFCLPSQFIVVYIPSVEPLPAAVAYIIFSCNESEKRLFLSLMSNVFFFFIYPNMPFYLIKICNKLDINVMKIVRSSDGSCVALEIVIVLANNL